MKVGISPNYSKKGISDFIEILVLKLKEANIDIAISKSTFKIKNLPENFCDEFEMLEEEKLASNSDVLISLGGDGTLLQTAYKSRKSNTPILGINFGKLGFLAEYDTTNIDDLIRYLKSENLEIQTRVALEAECKTCDNLYAINDIVIDRGRYPKMIEITIEIDDKYVATFSADGIIIATPTGSTGYSLSTGGPIVNPQTDVITLSPISAHTLSMRPLVISSNQKIVLKAISQFDNVQIICDGQRVHFIQSPMEITIRKSKHDLKLVSNKDKQYYEILRKKLHWGFDVRLNNGNGEL